jgi:acyl-CoA thioesterase FadM
MIFSYELVATSELSVRYLKPVKKGQTYAWHGEVARRDGRKIYIKSSIVELETGVVCATSEALMMTVNWEHKMGEVFHLLFNPKDRLPEAAP